MQIDPNDRAAMVDTLKQVIQGFTAAPSAINRAKERRFSLSAQMLTGEPIKVSVVDKEQACPAWYNMKRRQMYLNEASPRTGDPVEALIYDRGKLYHEVSHEEWTSHLSLRQKLANSCRDKQLFLDLSNILEDGRIERLAAKRWQGVKYYLRALLSTVTATSQKHPLNSLILYVRLFTWNNQAAADYWKPYQALIDAAIAAKTTKTVCENAYEITEALAQPKQPQPPVNQGQADVNTSQAEPESQGEDESDQGSSQEPQGEAESGDGDSEPDSGSDSDSGDPSDAEGGSQSESDGQDGGEDETEAESDSDPSDSDGHGHGQAAGQKQQKQDQAEAIEEAESEAIDEMKKLVEEAIEACRTEAMEDYEAILEEAATVVEPSQEYRDGAEEELAEQVSAVVGSLLVEANRQRKSETREGLLNPLALHKALTNGRCFYTKEEAPSPPHVALLIDTSSSINAFKTDLTKTARVLHGALLAAKVKSLVASFGGYGHTAVVHDSVPTDDFECGGFTPTGSAMAIANQWFQSETSNRGLMIVVTDGDPSDIKRVEEQFKKAEDSGTYVLGVVIGDDLKEPQKQFHGYLKIADAADLLHTLEAPLSDFLAGS